MQHRWYHAANTLGCRPGGGESFDLDFLTIAYPGDEALLEKHFVSSRSRQQRGVLTTAPDDLAKWDERLYARNRLSQNQPVNVIRSFIGIDTLQVHHMMDYTKLSADSVASQHITGCAGDI